MYSYSTQGGLRRITRARNLRQRPGLIDIDAGISAAILSKQRLPCTIAERPTQDLYNAHIDHCIAAYELRRMTSTTRQKRVMKERYGVRRVILKLPKRPDASLDKASESLAEETNTGEHMVDQRDRYHSDAEDSDTADTSETPQAALGPDMLLNTLEVQAVSRAYIDYHHEGLLRLSAEELLLWRQQILPAWLAHAAVHVDPWEVRHSYLGQQLARLWKEVLPCDRRVISITGIEYMVATHALDRWTSDIANAVHVSVRRFFEDTYGNDYNATRGYALSLVRTIYGHRRMFMWRDHDVSDHRDVGGYLLSRYLLAGLMAHTKLLGDLPQCLCPHDYPLGALSLSLASAERAIGFFCFDGRDSFGAFPNSSEEDLFSKRNWHSVVQRNISLVENVTQRRWELMKNTMTELWPEGRQLPVATYRF